LISTESMVRRLHLYCCAALSMTFDRNCTTSLFEVRAGSRMCFRLMKGPERGHVRNISDVRVVTSTSSAAFRVSSVVSFHSRDAQRAHKQEWLIETLHGNHGRPEADPEIRTHSPKVRMKWLREVQFILKQVNFRTNQEDIIRTLATISSD
jgi:hypothetical protein